MNSPGMRLGPGNPPCALVMYGTRIVRPGSTLLEGPPNPLPCPLSYLNWPVHRDPSSNLILPSRSGVLERQRSITEEFARQEFPPRSLIRLPPLYSGRCARLPTTASDTDAPATWQPLCPSYAFFRNLPRVPGFLSPAIYYLEPYCCSYIPLSTYLTGTPIHHAIPSEET